MTIKTKELKDVANSILTAISWDKNIPDLEISAKDNFLSLNVTNKEFFVSVRFALAEAAEFRAVVNANLFLSLISGITTETLDLDIEDNDIKVTAGKSSYKLPLVFDGSELRTIKPIQLANTSVAMTISNDVLSSILNASSKEILKGKSLDLDELQKMYYIDESGCFTYTTTACVNSFILEKPVKLLLNDKIVKNQDKYW